MKSGLKGKGDVVTYWLIGEDSAFKNRRLAERGERSASSRGKRQPNGMPPRSSLKVWRNTTGLARAASFESPKRLRFATNQADSNWYNDRSTVDQHENDIGCCIGDNIRQESGATAATRVGPMVTSGTSSTIAASLQPPSVGSNGSSSSHCDHLSASCPCIDHIKMTDSVQMTGDPSIFADQLHTPLLAPIIHTEHSLL